MAYIFLDESGDLGFDFRKKKTSKYFIISFLFIKNEEDKKSIDKIVKKIFNSFTKTEIKHHGGVLHCFKEKPKTRINLLKYLVKKDISIIAIYLNKAKVYTKEMLKIDGIQGDEELTKEPYEAVRRGGSDEVDEVVGDFQHFPKLQDEKQVLYNYVTNILLDRVFTKKLISLKNKIFLVASRRETNKFLNDNFCNYIMSQAKNKHKLDISIEIKTPFEEKCLQVADFTCWSLFRKYEHGDESYYNMIKTKIVQENPLFS